VHHPPEEFGCPSSAFPADRISTTMTDVDSHPMRGKHPVTLFLCKLVFATTGVREFVQTGSLKNIIIGQFFIA
jgi:hypothetical protein